MKRWNGTAYVDITTAKRWNGTAWVDLTIAKRWNGSAWVDIPLPGGGGGALSATVSPGGADGNAFYSCPGCPLFTSVCSNSVTVTATGGSGAGPTISWTQISGAGGINISNATAFTVSWCASIGRDRETSAVWRATITRGVTSVTVDVPVTLSYSSDL
jgi:hypothetical protein